MEKLIGELEDLFKKYKHGFDMDEIETMHPGDFEKLNARFETLKSLFDELYERHRDAVRKYELLSQERGKISEQEYWKEWTEIHEEEQSLREQGYTLREMAAVLARYGERVVHERKQRREKK